MRKKALRTGVILFCMLPMLLSFLCGCGQTEKAPDQAGKTEKLQEDMGNGQDVGQEQNGDAGQDAGESQNGDAGQDAQESQNGDTRQDAQESQNGDAGQDAQESQNGDTGQDADEGLDRMKERGYLLAGCKTDVPGLSYYEEETDTWSGLEVELAYQTAASLFQVSVAEAKERDLVKFVGVTVADREEKLEKKEVDCLFATYTITDERKQKFAFSDSYYTDYIGLMVRTSGEDANSLGTSEIRSIADLDGKKIGVAKNATTRKTFLNYIDTMNNITTAPVFFEYKSYEALFSALKDGSIDVMAVDVSILNGYVDHNTRILNDRFGGQHYGAAVRKENVALLEHVNAALAVP